MLNWFGVDELKANQYKHVQSPRTNDVKAFVRMVTKGLPSKSLENKQIEQCQRIQFSIRLVSR